MNTKLSLLTLGMTAIMASSAFAGDIKPLHESITNSLPANATACDVYVLQCGAPVTGYPTGQASSRVRDNEPQARPKVGVSQRNWNGTSCIAPSTTAEYDQGGTQTYATKPPAAVGSPDGNGTYGLRSTMSIAANARYCVKVCKAASNQNTNGNAISAVEAESYTLDTHCHPTNQPTQQHNASTIIQQYQDVTNPTVWPGLIP